MRSAISSNDIIHCTNYEGFRGILTSKFFQPSFCLEECTFLDFDRMNFVNKNATSTLQLAYPMVCFTDLPKDKRREHYKKFGEYALIMSEEWKLRNRISPLFYADKNFFSSRYGLTKAFDYILEKLEEEKDSDKQRITKTYVSFLMMYIKAFSAKKVCYYNEREWRWIPYSFDKKKMSLTQEEFNNQTIKNEVTQQMLQDPKNLLNFNFQDIVNLELPNSKYKKEVTLLLVQTFNVDYYHAKKKIKIRK